MSRQSGKITVPDNLRDLLLEFTINYLLEQPGDIVDFGIEYFTKLRDSRQSGLPKLGHSESADDSLSMDEGMYPMYNLQGVMLQQQAPGVCHVAPFCEINMGSTVVSLS